MGKQKWDALLIPLFEKGHGFLESYLILTQTYSGKLKLYWDCSSVLDIILLFGWWTDCCLHLAWPVPKSPGCSTYFEPWTKYLYTSKTETEKCEEVQFLKTNRIRTLRCQMLFIILHLSCVQLVCIIFGGHVGFSHVAFHQSIKGGEIGCYGFL